MESFSREWLALREAADHAARAERLVDVAVGALHGAPAVTVVDLAAGTGSNLRYLSSRLPFAQRWVLENLLVRLAPEPHAHGFVAQRSIVTNAAPHVGRAVVVNMDLRDFFPSVTFRRVKGLFHRVGYSEQVATVLALLCTEPPRVAAPPLPLGGTEAYASPWVLQRDGTLARFAG